MEYIAELPVLVDVDGVCADFMSAVLDFINTQNGTNFKYEEMHDDFRVVLKEYHTKEVEDFITSKGFCSLLKVLPGSQEGIEKLRKSGFRVMFLTSPYYNAPTWAFDRMNWLNKHFGVTREDVIFAKDKRFVIGNGLIDDLPKNCKDWFHHNRFDGTTVLLKQPWNIKHIYEMPAGIKIAHNFNEAVDFVIEGFL